MFEKKQKRIIFFAVSPASRLRTCAAFVSWLHVVTQHSCSFCCNSECCVAVVKVKTKVAQVFSCSWFCGQSICSHYIHDAVVIGFCADSYFLVFTPGYYYYRIWINPTRLFTLRQRQQQTTDFDGYKPKLTGKPLIPDHQILASACHMIQTLTWSARLPPE